MGFLNNHQDNFAPSTNPWGDDNITMYSIPKRKDKDLNISNMGYEEICEMISQLNDLMQSVQNEDDIQHISQKLDALYEEKSNRDELEEVTRIERGDAFEAKDTTVKEDVVVTPRPSPKPKIVKVTMEENMKDMDLDWDDLLSDDTNIPEYVKPKDNSLEIIMAGLIVIGIITIID